MISYPDTIRERGFTLVELLIAIFIFAIVISSVYGSYSATFHIVHGSEYQLKVANSARVVVERLAEDFGSIVTGPGGVFLGESHEYSDSIGDSLSFVSSAHLVLSKTDTLSGHALVQYLPELDLDTGLLNLYRSDVVLLPGVETDGDDVPKHLICRGLQEFRFTYVDQDGNETEEWQVEEVVSPGDGAETEETPFPSLVYVEFKFAESVESENSTVFKTAFALP
ncbi:MAG: prepilin-type N-terminal cleavage/methylation domain-containing protein [Desulforhopalus sp.]|nr:prepilin-type N-terminal cleavage/methylation domain-containing protein [Desulforhopalus sp.]